MTALKIRPGEGRMAALLIGVMLFTALGSSLGGNGIDALFFARFGVRYLPYMYVFVGLVTFVNLLAVTYLLGRVQRGRLYVGLPMLAALGLIGARLLVALDLNWFYPVLWLGKEVINAVQSLCIWGLAGTACDTRQAKRLFPLFMAGIIAGTVIGAFGTPLLVNWLHSENLLLVWAAALMLVFGLSRALLSTIKSGVRGLSRLARRAARAGVSSWLAEMQRGYEFIRRSPLLRWMAISAIFFSILWFSLLLPFTRAAAQQLPDEDALASFLGLFQGVTTGAALLISLFLANRLFARFGVMMMLLVYSIIYLLGFAVLAVYASFAGLIIFRFIQLSASQGLAEPAWQVAFNVVPPDRREQTRAFMSGVPGQAGIVIAGLILVIGEQALQPQQLYLVGLVAAALTTFILWSAKRAYTGALVEALRAGQPQVFFNEEEPFGGFQQDAAAVAAAVAGISNTDPAIRRVSAEILGHLSAPQAATVLARALNDSEPSVRAASLRALTAAKASAALPDVTTRLQDSEPEVREQAVYALQQLSGDPHEIVRYIQPLLNDPDPRVRAKAAVALLRIEGRLDDAIFNTSEARNTLRAMAAAREVDSRVNALEAFAECSLLNDPPQEQTARVNLVEAGLIDPAPAVRRAAACALARMKGERGIEPLARALSDSDRSVREAIARALGEIGKPALARVVQALSDSALERGALAALEHLPAEQAAPTIEGYAKAQIARALHYHELARRMNVPPVVQMDADNRMPLLVESLQAKAHQHGLNALRAIGLLSDRASIALARENLKSRDPQQRANALETLETVSHSELIRPLLGLWEPAEAQSTEADEWPSRLLSVIQDSDPWLRACAALAAYNFEDGQVRAALVQLAQSDPDLLVRETARSALNGARTMETLPTLSLMERILFLRRVPLFADLPPADLKQVAAIADERFFSHGEVIAEEGDPGDEMYIVVSGEVRVLTGVKGIEVARRKPGEYVGEMAIISQEPRMASLVAAGEVRTLCIGQKQFEGILRERPETSLAVMRVLCARLKERQ